MKRTQIALLMFLLLSTPVLADSIIPFSYATVALLHIVILIEFIVFLILDKRFYKKISVKMIFLVVFLANVTSSIFGIFPDAFLYISSHTYISYKDFFNINLQTLYGVLIYFIFTLIIEFIVFFLIIRKKYKLKELATICIILNIVSYTFITLFFAYTSPNPVRLDTVVNNRCNAVRGNCTIDPADITISPAYRSRTGTSANLEQLCKIEYDMTSGYNAKDCLNRLCGIQCP
jgi:hypothetical protein